MILTIFHLRLWLFCQAATSLETPNVVHKATHVASAVSSSTNILNLNFTKQLQRHRNASKRLMHGSGANVTTPGHCCHTSATKLLFGSQYSGKPILSHTNQDATTNLRQQGVAVLQLEARFTLSILPELQRHPRALDQHGLYCA